MQVSVAQTYAAYVVPLHKHEWISKDPPQAELPYCQFRLNWTRYLGSEEDHSTISVSSRVSSVNTCSFWAGYYSFGFLFLRKILHAKWPGFIGSWCLVPWQCRRAIELYTKWRCPECIRQFCEAVAYSLCGDPVRTAQNRSARSEYGTPASPWSS